MKELRNAVFTAMVLGLIFLAGPAVHGQGTADPKVLIVHSYTAQNQWTADQEAGFLKTLAFDQDTDAVDVVYLDAKQYNSPAYFEAKTAFLNQQYEDRSFDLVYVTDDYAVDFLGDRALTFLTPDTPIVFSGVNYAEDLKGDRITGVLEALDHRGMFTLLDELYEGGQSVLLVGDDSLTNERIKRSIEELLSTTSFDLQIDFLLTDDLNRLTEDVSNLEDAVLVMLVFNQDTSGRYYSYQQSFDLLYEVATIPIFSYWDFYLPGGAAGGMMLGGVENGAAAAELAGEILIGADPDDFPIVGVPSASYLNYSEAMRYSLSHERIETIAFEWYDRPVSFVQQHWEILIASLMIILTLLSIIILLVLNINKRREYAGMIERQKNTLDALNTSLEEKVLERTEQLAASLEETKRMHHEIIQAKKLASLGHLVAGISHEVNTPLGLSKTLTSYQSQLLDRLQETYGNQKMSRSNLEAYFNESRETTELLLANLTKATELMSSFKNISIDRISEKKRTFEVKAYLQEVVTSLTPEYKGMDVSFAITGDEVSMETYPGLIGQVFTNLVMNALRHGFENRQRGSIEVRTTDEGDHLRLLFHDDGGGIAPEYHDRIFDPFFTTKMGKGGSGLGLSIVYNAVVQKLKGSIQLVQADMGTTLVIRIPKEDVSDA